MYKQKYHYERIFFHNFCQLVSFAFTNISSKYGVNNYYCDKLMRDAPQSLQLAKLSETAMMTLIHEIHITNLCMILNVFSANWTWQLQD